MIDIDRILTGKIAHMLRECAPMKKDEAYCCALCSYCDVEDCETALENDISELQRLIDSQAGVKLEQLEYEKLEATRQFQTAEDLRRLSQFANLRSDIYGRSKT